MIKKAAVLFLVFFLSGCASAETRGIQVPSWARQRPPQGFIWGIGAGPADAAALALAQNRGRVSIARQLDRIARESLRDHLRDTGRNTEAGALDREAEGRLVSMNLENTIPVKSWKAPDGRWWSRVEISVEDAETAVMDALAGIIPGPPGETFRKFLSRRLARRAARPLIIAG